MCVYAYACVCCYLCVGVCPPSENFSARVLLTSPNPYPAATPPHRLLKHRVNIIEFWRKVPEEVSERANEWDGLDGLVVLS